jgi:putative ABC transport system ATP-binding protein
MSTATVNRVATGTQVVQARNVSKIFKRDAFEVKALDNVSIEIAGGEFMALMGPSGSGKTTLLSILGCIMTPTSGRVTVDGEEVDTDRPDRLPRVRRRAIGFVFQQYNLIPALTARENVEYALNIRRVRGRAAREEADRVLSEVGLSDKVRSLPRDLSGGQKQRVAIARAIAGRPPVLLVDEPTANLDSQTGEQILDLFRQLAKADNRGVLIVTHDPKVRPIADRVVTIRDGRLSSP